MAEKIQVWAHRPWPNGEWFTHEVPHETKAGGTQKPSTLVVHDGDTHEPVYTQSEVGQLVKTLRMAFNVVDELNADGFGPLTSKEGLDAFSAVVDALGVFDPA